MSSKQNYGVGKEVKGWAGFYIIGLLIAAAFFYWYIALPILCVLAIAVVAKRNSSEQAVRQQESPRIVERSADPEIAQMQENIVTLVNRSGRGPAQLSPARTDPNGRAIAELQDQITMAKQRNEIARLDNEWARLNKGES